MTDTRLGTEDDTPPGSGASPGVGSAVAWIAFSGAILLTIPAMGRGVLWGDAATARFVQRIDVPGAGRLATIANWIGSGAQVTILTFCLVVALCALRRYAAAGFVASTTLLHATNGALKAIAGSPRPTADLVTIREHASGLGFPSGHAMGAMLFYGALIVIAREQVSRRGLRLGIQVFAVGMILATGFGRVYVGAHWPSDVLGGYLWGLTALLGLRWAFPRMLTLAARIRAGPRTRLTPARGARLDARTSDD